AALVLGDRLLLILLLRGDELLVHASRRVHAAVPLHGLLPGLADGRRDDRPGGVVELEAVPGTEVAGECAEGDAEALLPVDEPGDSRAGARGIPFGEGDGHLLELLDGVQDVKSQ